jgi:GDP-D-mannose dehydratase
MTDKLYRIKPMEWEACDKDYREAICVVLEEVTPQEIFNMAMKMQIDAYWNVPMPPEAWPGSLLKAIKAVQDGNV